MVSWVPVHGNWTGTTAGLQRVMSEEDRTPVERRPVRIHPIGRRRERINRALADAVDWQATKDPGTRGILKSASVVCHTESELQKRIALPPHSPVTHGGSSVSGAQHNDIRNTDSNTGTGDVTREVETGPTNRMKTELDTRARRGHTAEGGSQRRADPLKSKMNERPLLNSMFQEGSRGKRRQQNKQSPSPRKRRWMDIVRKL